MLNFTPDTNTLVSATISSGNEYKLLKLAEEGKIKIILSPEIMMEFKEVISRPKFGFSNQQIRGAIKQIVNASEIIISTIKLKVIKEDPDDNKIIECAVSGQATHIVSGDNHILNLKEYGGIKIIRTSEALKLIENL